MPDLEISRLPRLAGADVQGTDPIAVADLSASETKKLSIADLLAKAPDYIPDDSISGDQIININGSQIDEDSITSRELAPNSVGSSELANNAVDTAAIQNGAVTNYKLADNIDGSKLLDGSVTDAKITGPIDGAKIGDNTITSTQLAPNSVGSSELADGAVDTAAIQNGAVTNDSIAGPIDGGKLAPDSITSTELAPNSVGSSELANNAVDTNAIQNGAVTGDKLASGIDGSKLLDGSVNDSKISSLDGSKINDNTITANELAPNSVGSSELADGAVDTAAIQSGAVTDAKITGPIDGGKLASNSVTSSQIEPGAIGTSELADGAVTNEKILGPIDGSKLQSGTVPPTALGAVTDRGLNQSTGNIGIANSITPGVKSGIIYDAQGLITGTTAINPTELPIATETEIGAVSVPVDGGLAVTGAGAVSINNTITPGTQSGIVYDEHGLITGTTAVDPAELPIAGTNADKRGVVYVPTTNNNPIQVAADGAVTHSTSDAPAGTYTKVTVSQYGHVTQGSGLSSEDIPNLNADKITSGQFPTARIEDGAITAPKLGDYSTCLMQEAFPGAGDFLGQFWYTPSTAQLRVYSRGSGPQNIWLPVGFGLLQQQNLRFAFTFDATTSTIATITQYGAPLGIAPGDPIPAATDLLAGAYGVCVTEGNGITLHDVNGTNFTIGDWILCAGEVAGWQHIDIADGAGGGGAQFLNDLLDVDTTIRVPEDGDILKYNAAIGQWINVPDSANAAVGDTPPSNATNGAMWWDTESGRLMVWYDDGNTEQWVVATPESGLTGGFPPTLPTLKVLNDLDDVEAGKFDGALLQYNARNLRWESTFVINGGVWSGIRTLAEAPALPASSNQPRILNDLLDVNAANIDKAFLQYDAGQSLWVEQLGFDGGLYGITRDVEDYVEPSIIGTTNIENLNDFQDVNAAPIDKAYVIYNDNLNYWQETTTIEGGNF